MKSTMTLSTADVIEMIAEGMKSRGFVPFKPSIRLTTTTKYDQRDQGPGYPEATGAVVDVEVKPVAPAEAPQ
jgi:hypothetical protein